MSAEAGNQVDEKPPPYRDGGREERSAVRRKSQEGKRKNRQADENGETCYLGEGVAYTEDSKYSESSNDC
jgi:hypothetical protein